MNINRIRLGLTYIFNESKEISTQSKLQLINFIESADLHQLKLLALDGEVATSSKLDENAKIILDERFNAADHIHTSLKKASFEALKKLASMKK